MPSNKKLLQAAAGNAGESLYVEDVFSTYLYTGNNSTQTITNGIDLDGEGGMVWLKDRGAAQNHHLYDTERGVQKAIFSNLNFAEITWSNALSSFNSTGFSIGDNNQINVNTNDYASWSFRKAEKFFDVVTFEAPSSPDTNYRISHNLGSAPGTILLKNVDSAYQWYVYHRSEGRDKYLVLNSTSASASSTGIWGTADPTSTDFGVNANDTGTRSVDVGSGTYIAYLFAHDAGGFGDDDESIIKCGSYTGNGSNTNGPVVDLGFEPQWLLVKSSSSAYDWMLVDVMRGMPAYDEFSNTLRANTNVAESASHRFNPSATGFQVNDDNALVNANGGNYIYIAIRRPMKTPEAATEVFTTRVATEVEYNNTVDYGITTDLLLNRYNKSGSQYTMAFDRMRGSSKILYTALSDAEGTLTLGTGNKGFGESQTSVTWPQIANSSTSNVTWAFKRATGFFDVVAYTGNGTAGTTETHNLNAIPELMIVKRRSANYDWVVYHKDVGATKALFLNKTDSAETQVQWWNNTAPTSSVFTKGNVLTFSGQTYIAYLFATVAGVSKVGSYTGTGSNVDVDCGFSAGARFILIKRSDSTGDWYVYDSERGIVAGNDPYLLLNTTAAEVTNTDYVDPLNAGFTVTSSAPAALNASGGSYIFLAIA